jgi:poly-beta-1,6-N-acetyl-D-glucosamine biosynthesis protein PgaD
MKIALYDPSLKDTNARDILSRFVTLALWLGYLWICKDLLRLLPDPIGSLVPGRPFMDPSATQGVLLYMLKLIGIAYFISVSFLIWRFFVEAYLRTQKVRKVALDLTKVGETFGLDDEGVRQFQAAKNVEVDVRNDGTIVICSVKSKT